MSSPTDSASSRPVRPVRRRETTRAQLMAAATAIFEDTGTTTISVEAVVSRAGFTRGAFYSNFTSVEELFFAAYEDQSNAVFAHLERMLRPDRAVPGTRLDDAVRSIVDGMPLDERWFALRAVLMTRARRDSAMRELLTQHNDRFCDTLRPLLVESLSRVGRRPSVDPSLFTRAVVAAHVGALSQSVVTDDTDGLRVAAVEGCLLGLTEPVPVPGR